MRREPSYGHAILTIYNSTVAKWEWHRNQVCHVIITISIL